ncbi:MAG: hypothetical protein NC089_02640 [Bacteroides sp.]|nr:hypothetical protein [Bacteroides sp.]MCM1550737.1 hypothetical protein [Clostridium sp.]
MKTSTKKTAAGFLAVLIILSLTGCSLMGNSKKTYANYVQSLLDVNYKAEFTEYMKITNSTQEEAQVVYDDGLDYLADALMTAYGINDVEGSDIRSQFVELAKEIYSHASYEIGEVTKTDGVYQVTVNIQPIDILLITYEDVVAYIEDINQRVTNGEYNDYELDDYEIEYAQGIIDILKEAMPNIGNGETIPVTVTILDNDEYYYISDADFLALDKAILATTITAGGEEEKSDNASEADTAGAE